MNYKNWTNFRITRPSDDISNASSEVISVNYLVYRFFICISDRTCAYKNADFNFETCKGKLIKTNAVLFGTYSEGGDGNSYFHFDYAICYCSEDDKHYIVDVKECIFTEIDLDTSIALTSFYFKDNRYSSDIQEDIIKQLCSFRFSNSDTI